MTDYLFQEVPVFDRLGVNLMLARGQRIDVLDSQLEITSPGLKQQGQPVPYVTTDQLGRATFTTTQGFVRLRAPKGLERIVYSPQYLQENLNASTSAANSAASAAASATSAQNAANLVGAPADSAIAAAVNGAATATRAAIDARYLRRGDIFINVKDPAYGAKGDGSTDDTTALQAAIDACTAAGGGTVFLPAGIYRTDPLKLKSKVRLEGVGPGSLLRRYGPLRTAGPLLSLSATTDYQVQIANLSIDGSNLGALATEHAITLDGGANSTWGAGSFSDPMHVIADVLIYNVNGRGIYLKGFARETVLSHVYIRNVGNVGVYVDSGCSDCKFFDVKVSGSGFGGTTAGSSWHGFYLASNVSLVQCKAYFSGSTTNPSSGFVVDTGNRSVLVGCEGQDNGGNGLIIQNASGVVVSGFMASGNAGVGLLTVNATDMDVRGFYINSSGTRYNTFTPLSFQSGSTGVFEGTNKGANGTPGGNALGSMSRVVLNATSAGTTRVNMVPHLLATKTANYTLLLTDQAVVFNGASLTATLPDPSTVVSGHRAIVKNINATALTVVSAGTSKTIDGAASVSLTQWAKGTFVSDGTQWLTL